MTASHNLPFVLTFVVVVALCLMQASCPDDSSIEDCSRRNQPQHYDGKQWTCKERK